LQETAYVMCDAVESGQIDELGVLLRDAFEAKKRMNPHIAMHTPIEAMLALAQAAGASGGKICGAGGGGYLLFYCRPAAQPLVRAELESLATELAAPKFTEAELRELEIAEETFSKATQALRARPRERDDRWRLTHDWVVANHGFHDVIYRVAETPLIERLAKSARRSFSGHAVWAPGGSETDALYERNDNEHRAIIAALRAGTPAGARALAREHVLHSFELLAHVLEQFGNGDRRLRAERT